MSPTLDAAGSYTRDRYSANGFPPFPPGVPVEATCIRSVSTRRGNWMSLAAPAARRSRAGRSGRGEFGRRNVLITISGEVARHYVAARAFQRRLAVAEANLQAQEEILALTRDRFAKGLDRRIGRAGSRRAPGRDPRRKRRFLKPASATRCINWRCCSASLRARCSRN